MKPVVVLLLAAAGATAVQAAEVHDDDISMEGSATPVSTIYEVDEDRDGRTDRLLILEQSDSLA